MFSFGWGLNPGRWSLNRQCHLGKVFRQIAVLHHCLALAPGDDVDRELARGKRDHIICRGIEPVRFTDVLLILVNKLNVFFPSDPCW